MILSDIRDYLRERGQASLSDIALHFDSEPDAIRGMLAIWIRKGKVTPLAGPACGGCNQCDAAASEVYQWITDGTPPQPDQGCRQVLRPGVEPGVEPKVKPKVKQSSVVKLIRS